MASIASNTGGGHGIAARPHRKSNPTRSENAWSFNVVHIWSILLGTSLLGFGFAISFEDGATYLAWSTTSVLYAAYAVFLLFSKRMFMLSTLLLFLTYGVAIVWATNYAAGLPMSSWRSGWESSFSFPQALGLSIQYITFLGTLSIFAISFVPKYRPCAFDPLDKRYTMPVTALTAMSGLTLFAIAGTQARDQYLRTADIGSMFLVQASSIMLATLFAFTLFYLAPGRYRNATSVILVSIAFIVGMNGFRFLLIIFAFIAVFYILATRRISVRWAFGLVVAFVVSYSILLIVAYTRSVGMTFGDAIAFAFQPDLKAAYGYAGASDQANIIALDYYTDQTNVHLLNGRTYVDAFLRLAPNIVHTTYFDTLRSQDYIMQTGSFVPEVFRQSNWTMGAHLFVEATFNFGKCGPYLVLTLLVAIVTLLERFARSSPTTFIGYIVVASMGYSLAWYGFANSLKQGAFAFACSAMIIAAGKFLTRRRTGIKPTTLITVPEKHS